MFFKPLRTLLTALGVEILTILWLVIFVYLFGPSDTQEAEAFANEWALWVGPIAGFLMTVLGAWFIARSAPAERIAAGLVLGVAVAVIDVLILVLSDSGFEWVFVISNIGRVVAGGLGGWIAYKFSERP